MKKKSLQCGCVYVEAMPCRLTIGSYIPNYQTHNSTEEIVMYPLVETFQSAVFYIFHFFYFSQMPQQPPKFFSNPLCAFFRQRTQGTSHKQLMGSPNQHLAVCFLFSEKIRGGWERQFMLQACRKGGQGGGSENEDISKAYSVSCNKRRGNTHINMDGKRLKTFRRGSLVTGSDKEIAQFLK